MIVLDTHVLVWWVNGGGELSLAASNAITDAVASGRGVQVSAISAWEIAMLVDNGRLALSMDLDDWLATVAAIPDLRIMPVTARVAVQSTRLPGAFHADPADRMIVAFVREQNATLATADRRIQAYPHVRWLW